MDYLNTILYLVPGAQFGLWECTIDQYHGEPNPIEIDTNVWVDWSATNTQPCPTLAQLQAIDPAVIAATVPPQIGTISPV